MLDYKLLTWSHSQVLFSHAKGGNEDGKRYNLQFLIAAVLGIVNVIDVLTGTWRWIPNHTAQHRHAYTYYIHCHRYEHSRTIVSLWNLLTDHSCWIASNGTTLTGRLGAGMVFTPGEEIKYKRLMAVQGASPESVNTCQTLRITSRGGTTSKRKPSSFQFWTITWHLVKMLQCFNGTLENNC